MCNECYNFFLEKVDMYLALGFSEKTAKLMALNHTIIKRHNIKVEANTSMATQYPNLPLPF